MRPLSSASPVRPASDEAALSRYRAALLSINLATHPRWSRLARLLPPSEQPTPLERYSPVGFRELLDGFPPEQVGDARFMAAQLLAEDMASQPSFTGTSPTRESEPMKLWPYLQVLLRPEQSGALRQRIKSFQHESIGQHVTPDDISRAIHGLPSLRPSPSFGARASKAGGDIQVWTDFDEETLTTTVQVTAYSSAKDPQALFASLRRLSDPQSWSADPHSFWRFSNREVPLPGGIFKEEPQESGDSWQGYLYEHVVWNWNERSIAAFQNYLNIDFKVDPEQLRIDLAFSLHSCQGSLLFARVSASGVDVDHGFLSIEPVELRERVQPHSLTPAVERPVQGFRITTQKVLRFSNLQDRRHPYQGLPGSGSALSYMAPASVSLWLRALMAGIYEEEKALR